MDLVSVALLVAVDLLEVVALALITTRLCQLYLEIVALRDALPRREPGAVGC